MEYLYKVLGIKFWELKRQFSAQSLTICPII